MPSVNIPAKIRFVLYLAAAIGSLAAAYTVEKGWAGEAELRLWAGIAGLLSLLAAANTDLTDRRDTGRRASLFDSDHPSS